MIHTYQHQFKDGTVLTLAVDLTTDTPRMASSLSSIPENCCAEYLRWAHEVLLPDLTPRLSASQMAAFALIGLDISGHSGQT